MNGDSIPKAALLDKLSRFATPLIVVLVGLGAFGLGRLSALEEGRGSLKIYAPTTPASQTSGVNQAAAVVGSIDSNRTLAAPVPASTEQLSAVASSTAEVAHHFAASKNGTKYYPAGCSGASRIKPANQVWFATAADAQAAGYTLASGCK